MKNEKCEKARKGRRETKKLGKTMKENRKEK
jgi:hypothetical protein